jgi:hypothetical protein
MRLWIERELHPHLDGEFVEVNETRGWQGGRFGRIRKPQSEKQNSQQAKACTPNPGNHCSEYKL